MPECIIVGGGVIGLLTARELHRQGVDVLLIERGSLGGESSWAGGGIISPLYPWLYHDAVSELAQISKTMYPDLVSELNDETGADCELIQSGLLIAGHEENEQALKWSKTWSTTLSVVSGGDEINAIEPEVASSITDGFWMPDVMQIRNPKFVAALKKSFEHHNIPYLENTPVAELLIEEGKALGVRLADREILSDKVIIASGAWSSGLLNESIDVEPVKGQMIMYKGIPDKLHRIVLSRGHYIIPRADGRILAGSTLEKKGFDKSISKAAMQELHEAAISIVPGIERMTIERQWAGLRPGTKHGIPYICQHDEVSGLYINSGHYRNGIVMGPASATLLADLVLEKKTSIDMVPYLMSALH